MQRPGSALKTKTVTSVYRIYGLFYDPEFYLIEILIRALYSDKSNQQSRLQFEFYKLNQTQFDYYQKLLKRNFPDKRILAHQKGSPIITCNFTEYLSNVGKIVELFQKPLVPGQIYRAPDLVGEAEIRQSEGLCRDQIHKYFNKSQYVYFILNCRNAPNVPSHFKVIIQLFKDSTPKSCAKFIELCLAKDGYPQTSFHRLCKNYFLQGGKARRKFDFFEDEMKNFIKHDKPGIVGLTNMGYQHSNDVQFYITFNQIPGFDGKTVVIGQIIMGMRFLNKINKAQNFSSQKPVYDLTIVESGVYHYDPDDFIIKGNPKRVSTAPYKDRIKDDQLHRISKSMHIMHDSNKFLPNQSQILEQNIIESSKFLFDLSEDEDEEFKSSQFDLIYSQSKPSFFGVQTSKKSHQGRISEDYQDVLPLTESLSEYQPSRHLDSRVSRRLAEVDEQPEQMSIVESYDVKISYVSGF